MESVLIDGVQVSVTEVYRPDNFLCRLLKTPASEYILEYVVSTGPYKIDIIHYHRFSAEQAAQFRSGELDVGELAVELERLRQS